MDIIGFDTETYLIAPGRNVPPVVCLTLAGAAGRRPEWLAQGDDVAIDDGADTWTALITRGAIVPVWRVLVADALAGRVRLVAHNAAFDLLVLSNVCALAADADGGPPSPPGPRGLAAVFALVDAVPAPAVACTQVRETLIAIADDRLEYDDRTGKPFRGTLAAAVMARFGVDLSESKGAPDAWRLRYAELAGVPAVEYPAAAREYALDDAVWTRIVYLAQGADPSEAVPPGGGDAVTDEGPQVAASVAFALCSAWGFRTDPAASATFAALCREKVAEGEAIAEGAGFLRAPKGWRTQGGNCKGCGAVSPRGAACAACGFAGERSKDMAALRDRVVAAYRARGLDAPLTEQGAISTARETLEESDDPALVAYAATGVWSKYLTTYVPTLEGGWTRPVNHRLHTLVASGRSSASDPNTQNPPKSGGFRECIVPRRGWLFCSVDYDVAELKALGQILLWWFGSSALADAINAGQDPHLAFAARLLAHRWGRAVTYADVKAVPKDAAHILYLDVHGPKGARQLAKVANFGFPGGLGSEALVDYAKGYGVELTPDEAAELKDLWFAEWREMPDYFAEIGALTESGPTTIEQVVSGRKRGGVRFTQAANTFFQGLVADFAKQALYRVQCAAWSVPSSPLFGVRPVFFVHDEVIAEIPAPWAYPDLTDAEREGLALDGADWTPEQTTAAADALAAVMVATAGEYCPDVKMSASPCLMYRWTKSATEVRDDAGRLLPWSSK